MTRPGIGVTFAHLQSYRNNSQGKVMVDMYHRIVKYATIYLYMNLPLLFIGFSLHLMLSYFPLLSVPLLTLKNLAIVALVHIQVSSKPDLSPRQTYVSMFMYEVIKFSVFESIVLYILQSRDLIPLDTTHSIDVSQLKYFISHSFLFEVIFDLFHYTAHRLMHTYPLLYKYTHKTHHYYSKPTILTTFHESIGEHLLSNALPTIFSIQLMHTILGIRVSQQQFCCIAVYKTYIEVSGHCGKDLGNVSSFPQCIWLPKLLGIQLFSTDHDHHHAIGNANFSKRFSLWDKVFGTYGSKE
jgi:sterol desaturase/sphingolipid hydroxylase (fatty acid hydroxylase superfamily)